jgi:hypothetical protein
MLNEKVSLLRRTGKVINGRYYIISVYSHAPSGVVLVEAYNVDTRTVLGLAVPAGLMEANELVRNLGVCKAVGAVYITLPETGRRLYSVFYRNKATWWVFKNNSIDDKMTYIEVLTDSRRLVTQAT